MAQILGLNIVAEGVEFKEHVDICVDLGIAQSQGYYFSKPLDREDIEKNYIHKGKLSTLIGPLLKS